MSFRPLHDRVVVRRLTADEKTAGGIIIPDTAKEKPQEGEVVSAGTGARSESGEVHPMHLHGHHILVLSRNGIAAQGSPWWVDSLEVGVGESYDIAFVADNPGLWMDHCHNLTHAAEGLVAHLMYTGVTSSYVVGGDDHNQPE